MKAYYFACGSQLVLFL